MQKLGLTFIVLILVAATTRSADAQRNASSENPDTTYHLTAHPWSPLKIPKEQYLDAVEGICRFSIKHQREDGAIVDPIEHRELQYSTPYFAYAVGTLVRAGRAMDLLPNGVSAMEHSTSQFEHGRTAIPDQHGEFFIAALTEALEVYKPLVTEGQYHVWRERLRTPILQVTGLLQNNWMTYSMKGEWLRFKAGLVLHSEAISFIENAWRTSQRDRIFNSSFHLYHDRSSDPDTLSVEAVGRGNLLALINEGYDGPSASEIRLATEDGTWTSLLLQDPTGQAPANGRTDNHVWVDAGYQLAFQTLANAEWAAGRRDSAAVFQHASELSFAGLNRWRRNDGDWAGSYFITKNHFDPSLRVGYQTASHISNYTGALMFHLAEAYNARQNPIPESAAPSEIGGYAITLDSEFASTIANAGGLQIQINLRGQKTMSNGNFWSPLGIVRISRAGWDSRIGPADGALTETSGISFAPEFFENDKWLRMASLSARYHATWNPKFVHPALVRGTLIYRPIPGQSGPIFESKIWITPDGVFVETHMISKDAMLWAVTWPILQNDGRPLRTAVTKDWAATGYENTSDQEVFISLADSPQIKDDGPALRSSFGDLAPLRVEAATGIDRTFIYPRNPNQPSPDQIKTSLKRTQNGFSSLLGRIAGNLYIGKTVAGGVARSLALPGSTLNFNRTCGFLVVIRNGQAAQIETDREVRLVYNGQSMSLHPHIPTDLPRPKHRQ
jgi:hypothetical protein